MNIVCGSLLPAIGFLYGNYYYEYDSKELTLLLIAFAVANSVLILYTICLVSKFGCYFLEGKKSECSNGTGDIGPHAVQVLINNTLSNSVKDDCFVI